MNRNTEVHFSNIPQVNMQRSKFDLSNKILTTANAGRIIPIEWWEVLPGSTFKIDTQLEIRTSTMIRPVMDDSYADLYYFFVPFRLVWDHWEEFNGASDDEWIQKTEYTVPWIKPPKGGWKEKTIADYMGVRPNVEHEGVNQLNFRAYCKIINDWFRNTNLMKATYFSKGDADIEGSNGDDYVTDPAKGGMPVRACKFNDYFTSALPDAQRSVTPVTIPLGTTAPVVGDGKTLGLTNGESNFGLLSGVVANNWVARINTAAYDKPAGTQNVEDSAGFPSGSIGVATENSGMVADLSQATASKINDLIKAFATQDLLTLDARGGNRYTSILESHFKVKSPDARLQRAEYLGGKRIKINVQAIAQSSGTQNENGNQVTPQGNLSGVSYTSNYSENVSSAFTEHGVIIAMLCIRTNHTYQQGIEKGWSRKRRFDFYLPALANIGEQLILNKEIYAQGTEEDNQGFGYQEAWAEYRFKPNRVSGQMRSDAPGSLDSWHYADDYDSKPVLGPEWIMETEKNVDRTLAIQSSISDQYIIKGEFITYAYQPMPLYSIPGLRSI